MKDKIFMRERYINPFTDFGFKRLLGEEPNKDLLLDFLNELLRKEKGNIKTITYLKNEHLPYFGERKAIFDIYCENEAGEKFIVEIQKTKQNFFKYRTVYEGNPKGDEKNMDTQTIEKGFERVWQMFQETDRKFQETDRKFQETDRKFDREIGELKELFRQTDRRIGDITGKWGRFVEGMVVPGMTAMFETRGIRIERLFQRVRVRKDGAETEIDILGISDAYAVPVEVKSTLSPDDVKE